MTELSSRPDVAYIYPAPYWSWGDSGWVRSLLLFFDQVAILLPDYMYGRHTAADSSLVEPLEDRGLLRVLEPNDWVDGEMTTQLAEVMVELLTNGALDDLDRDCGFHELSRSRMGYGADVGLADMLVEELLAQGLARPSEDGVSMPLHPTVRTTILVTLGQLARAAGDRRGLVIHPATNYDEAARDLVEMLSRDQMPSAEHVVRLDLEPVGFDMDAVPLDDLLDFRAEHHDAHTAYMRDLRRFMTELAAVDDPGDRESLLLERQQELAEAAHDLQRSTRRALGKNLASWSLGLVGGAWALGTGDPIGLALAAASLAPGLISDGSTVTAYSYLFAAHDETGLGYR